ncbi:MAG: rRNA pseudouridine synthase [Desulfobulbaceae bacterium]|nr:rRNA pseudouridine synthase [Desulfobulbaceae bacterium]
MAEERLQKVLAAAGLCSRRQAEKLISAGRVSVDGQIINTLGSKIDPTRQKISVDGRPLAQAKTELVYYLLNKPRGYVTTMSDPQGRPLVTSLLKGVKARVFPVGRLDIDTSGALILTNDGELTQKVLHPSNEINRTYLARVAGKPSEPQLDSLRRGILMEGRKTWPARIRVVGSDRDSTNIEITIHEGRKRQVRKMFAAIGHPVWELARTAYAKLELGNLPIGRFRELTPKDLEKLFL